jgi:hypothetical protein
MYAYFTKGELLVSAGLAGVIIWVLDWRSEERAHPIETNQTLMATFLGEGTTRQRDKGGRIRRASLRHRRNQRSRLFCS